MGRPSPGTIAALHEAIDRLTQTEATGTERTLELFEAVERARKQVSQLVHADPSSILLVENTSRGLGLVASSLPLERGDNILVDDLEFLSATVVWRTLCQRRGVEIRPVPTRGGEVHPEHFAARRSRALVLSSVQEVSGYRASLHGLAELSRQLGAYLIVDGIQEVGAVPVDLGSCLADAYCAGGHKWLRSPLGLGFLYVSPQLLERLTPPSFGFLALEEPEGGWELYLQSPTRTPFDSLPTLSDVRRLNSGGMPNALGAIALYHAAEESCRVGPEAVWQKICSLRTRLIEGLRPLGVRLFPFDAEGGSDHVSGIVCFGLPEGLVAERALWRKCIEARVYLSLRYISGIGGIRASIHYDNTAEDVNRLLAVSREFLRA